MSDTQSAALTADDYGALYKMSLSPDASVRAQASSLATKLTPDERQQFFDFQKAQTKGAELHREDNSLLGMPPEAVAAGVIPVAGAMGEAGSAGLKAAAGLKASVAQAAPAVKYQVTKSALEHIGVPSPLAMAAAFAVSGYRSGARAAESAPTPPTKPSFSAKETAQGLNMIRKGVSYQDAMEAVLKLRDLRDR